MLKSAAKQSHSLIGKCRVSFGKQGCRGRADLNRLASKIKHSSVPRLRLLFGGRSIPVSWRPGWTRAHNTMCISDTPCRAKSGSVV